MNGVSKHEEAVAETGTVFAASNPKDNDDASASEPNFDLEKRRRRRKRPWAVQVLLAYWRPMLLLVTPLAALPLPLISGLNRDWCAYMMIIMAVYWVFQGRRDR